MYTQAPLDVALQVKGSIKGLVQIGELQSITELLYTVLYFWQTPVEDDGSCVKQGPGN